MAKAALRNHEWSRNARFCASQRTQAQVEAFMAREHGVEPTECSEL